MFGAAFIVPGSAVFAASLELDTTVAGAVDVVVPFREVLIEVDASVGVGVGVVVGLIVVCTEERSVCEADA